MVRYCMVRGCQNSSETPNIEIFRFPTDGKIRKLWIVRLCKEGYQNTFLKSGKKRDFKCMSSGVCSAHFKPEDYRILKRRKCLKRDAQPSIFPSSCANTLTKSAEVHKAHESENEGIDFANLPELVLIKIFNYLSFENRLLAGSVCHKWYEISRSRAVWRDIHIRVPSPYHVLKFIVDLPPSVRHLSITCFELDIHNPLWLPDILSRLHQRCPHIKSLMFENVYFSQRFCNTGLTTDHILCSSQTSDSFTKNKGYKNVRDRPVCVNECCSKPGKYGPENRLEELMLLSVRHSHSFFCHLSSSLSPFFPKIKILDLSFSVSVKDAVIPFFARLSNLEELYLSGCPITNSGIQNLLKHLKKLKVLDLEHSQNVDDTTFQIIQTFGLTLKSLYLGFTPLRRLFTLCVRNEQFELIFEKSAENRPNLQELCLRATDIDALSIVYLAVQFPSLKFVDVDECENCFGGDSVLVRNEAAKWNKNLQFERRTGRTSPCCHFKVKYDFCD